MIFTVESDTTEEDYRIMALPFPGVTGSPAELLRPSALANVIFDLSEYFRTERITEYSSAASAIHLEACKSANIAFYEYYGNPPAGENEETWTGLIMSGRIPRWKHYELLTYESFYAYLTTEKRFLTWYPRTGKKVLLAQPERLYWLNTSSATPATLSLKIQVFFSDGTNGVFLPATTATSNPNIVVSFATGYNQLNIEAWRKANYDDKDVIAYSVQVMISSTAVSEAFLYTLDLNDYRNVRYLIFRNSMVGYDCLACTGEADEITDIERYTANRVADVNDQTRLHKVEYRTEDFESVKVNTGWLSKNDRKWLSELFFSPEIYELSGTQMIRILLKTKQFDRTHRTLEPGSVEIEYERLFPAL